MTRQKIFKMIQEMGIPSAYHQFAEGEAPELPYLVWYSVSSDNFGADNIVYFEVKNLNIELYLNDMDETAEIHMEKIEKVLTENRIFFNKTEIYIDEEKMFEILYEISDLKTEEE